MAVSIAVDVSVADDSGAPLSAGPASAGPESCPASGVDGEVDPPQP
jgi:hypothetical protein